MFHNTPIKTLCFLKPALKKPLMLKMLLHIWHKELCSCMMKEKELKMLTDPAKLGKKPSKSAEIV